MTEEQNPKQPPAQGTQNSVRNQEAPTEMPETPISRYDIFIGRLKNHPIIALVMVFAFGIGGASTFLENVERIVSWVSAHVISDEASRTLNGRVHEFSDLQHPVASAKVLLGLNDTANLTSDTNGEFKFVVPSAEIGKRVLISIRASGYAPFDFPKLPLSPPFDKVDIPLSPLVDPGHDFGKADVALLGARPQVSAASDPLNFHSFEFNYTFDPPGLRRWTKIDDRLWIETYQDNNLSFFPVLHTATIDGCQAADKKRGRESFLTNHFPARRGLACSAPPRHSP